ncbi:MAG: signal peptidase I [Pirellulaceae bacterium]|nr:signal peptidase I [Pirellulaceae bacterium]
MWLLAQNDAGGAIGGMLVMVIQLAIIIAVLVGAWKMFQKAGKPGWAAIIPIYNIIVILEICGRPLWWILLMLIPCVNIVVAVIVWIDVAKSFGKSELFGLGLAFLGFIFIPILGFGSAQYVGPAAAGR